MKKTLVMMMAAVLTGSMTYPVLAEEYVFEMAPVVVTANRVNENLVDARADISVVTSRQIEKLHLNTVEDALRTVPGTQYLNYGGNGLNANLSGIRINGSKDIILLVDGVRVTDFNGANNSGYMYSSLLNNMDNVERIEVLRGSAGALYGSGAKGGVINIITKNPGEKKTTVDIARGTGGREMYKLTTMGRVGKFSYMAYYDKLLIGDTKSGDGRLWPGHTHTLSDGVKFAYDVTDKHSLSLSYDKMKSRYRGYDFVYSNRYHGDYKSDMLTLQDKISIGKHWDNQFTYRRNKVKTNYFQDYDMNAQSNWGISSDYTYDIIGEQVSFHDEWNRLTFGVDYSKGRDNVLRAAGFDVNGNPVKTNHWYENYSFYIQEDWNFLPRWSLSGGLRHDRPETDQYTADFSSHTSKSYRLSYEVTPWMNEKYGDTGTSWGGKNFEGSHLTKLAGGASAAKAGQIFQKDTGNITVDNYSGYTDVYYAHEETAPKAMIGGDFIIRKAASGSGISLITDNKGLNTSSNASADKNLVSETLNALANKLFYKAYADGENNLTGFVKIAEGLTSSEAVLKTGNITFKKDNGQGQYLYETAYPNEQVTDPINKTIDGSTASEQVYKEAGVYKSDTDTYKFTKNPATVNGDSGAAVDAGAKDIHVDSGENTLNLNGGNTGVGVKAEGGKTADIKGNANITGKTGVVADGAGSKVLLSGNSNITAEGDGIVASGGGIVEAAGITNVTAGAGGKAVRAGAGSSVSLRNGKLKGDVEADNGTVSLHGAETEGNVTAAAGGSINLTDGSVSGAATADNGTIETENTNVVNGASALNGGKLKLRNGTVSGGIKTDAASTSDVVMDRAGASLQGDVSGEGKTNVTLSNGGSWKGSSTGSGETKVKVESDGIWTGTSMNSSTDVDLRGKWQQTGDSKVRKLVSTKGTLDKTDSVSGTTDIGHFGGEMSLIYAHDKTNPTKVLGGGTFIAAADAGSTVDMITDNAGLDTNSKKAADKNKVSEALNALAGKLQYTGYQNGERNLKGKLRIAEGLTSSSAGLKTEALSFKRDGQGYFDYTPAKPDKPEIETGDYETSIMSSTRSALTSSILVWRNDMNDMYKRMGDLRIGAESGLWARAYGGRISYDANNAYMKDSYWAAQVGMDKRLASGWHVGGAFGYTDGSATYRYGGKGDPKLYTLAAYATRVSEDGQYVDVIAKAGKLSNKFTAYNKYSAPVLRNYVEGKYDTYGYGISAEYGKKIRMGKGFITPQAELTWSRLSSDSFDAAAPTGESMRVSQSSVNSLVGRLGVVAGVESDKGNFYAKVNLFHEFDGDGHILFTEPGKTGKRSSFSLKDTWVEIALGGNYYLSPRSMIYADFTKSFGGDYKVDWRINAGIRFSF